MILSDSQTPFNDSQVTTEYANDWHSDRAEYHQSQTDEMPTWIKTNREQFNIEINQQYDVTDINSLNEMQRRTCHCKFTF